MFTTRKVKPEERLLRSMFEDTAIKLQDAVSFCFNRAEGQDRVTSLPPETWSWLGSCVEEVHQAWINRPVIRKKEAGS